MRKNGKPQAQPTRDSMSYPGVVHVKKAGTNDRTPVEVASEAQLQRLVSANGIENVILPDEQEQDDQQEHYEE